MSERYFAKDFPHREMSKAGRAFTIAVGMVGDRRISPDTSVVLAYHLGRRDHAYEALTEKDREILGKDEVYRAAMVASESMY